MNDRRSFIKTLAGTAAVSGILTPSLGADFMLQESKRVQDGLTVLFQGDSITDGNRTRNKDWNHVMGHGYAYTIASKLWYEHPTRGFHFYNRGISGNRIPDLAGRWQSDTLDLKPDILSILVGINDTHFHMKGDPGLTSADFETGYRSLLKRTIETLPNVRFVLCEPFILPVGPVKLNWDQYKKEVALRQDVVKRLSQEFPAIHIPFQSAFNEALLKAPAEYWIWDGIHPMPAGHELMARVWIDKVHAELGV